MDNNINIDRLINLFLATATDTDLAEDLRDVVSEATDSLLESDGFGDAVAESTSAFVNAIIGRAMEAIEDSGVAEIVVVGVIAQAYGTGLMIGASAAVAAAEG
jgi:hypothetical protein